MAAEREREREQEAPPPMEAPPSTEAPLPTELRASHGDRELVADRLRAALDEGRLTLAEYDERVGIAYGAITYADLNKLLTDLPTQTGVLEIRPPSATAAPAPAGKAVRPARPRKRRRMPLAMSILWTIWGGVTGINVAVWAIVEATTAGDTYFWPIWVGGPTGAALAATTIGVQAIRRQRDEDHGAGS